jgi:hypothetical protein
MYLFGARPEALSVLFNSSGAKNITPLKFKLYKISLTYNRRRAARRAKIAQAILSMTRRVDEVVALRYVEETQRSQRQNRQQYLRVSDTRRL